MNDQDRLPTVVAIVIGGVGAAIFFGWRVWTELRDGVLELPNRGIAPVQHHYYEGIHSPVFWITVAGQVLLGLFLAYLAIAVVARAVRVNRRLRRRRLSR